MASILDQYEASARTGGRVPSRQTMPEPVSTGLVSYTDKSLRKNEYGTLYATS